MNFWRQTNHMMSYFKEENFRGDDRLPKSFMHGFLEVRLSQPRGSVLSDPGKGANNGDRDATKRRHWRPCYVHKANRNKMTQHLITPVYISFRSPAKRLFISSQYPALPGTGVTLCLLHLIDGMRVSRPRELGANVVAHYLQVF